VVQVAPLPRSQRHAKRGKRIEKLNLKTYTQCVETRQANAFACGPGRLDRATRPDKGCRQRSSRRFVRGAVVHSL